MVRKQRALSPDETDRFLVTTSKKTGDRIRLVADAMSVTYSKFIGDVVEAHLSEFEARMEGDNDRT